MPATAFPTPTPPTMVDRDALLTLEDVHALGYPAPRTLFRYIADGVVPGYWLDGRRRIARSDLHLLHHRYTKAPLTAAQREWAEKLAAEAPPMTRDDVVGIVHLIREAVEQRSGGASE